MNNRSFEIRLIQQTDDKRIEEVIRNCLIEFGANRPGFAWQDPELSRLSSAYQDESSAYWVALDNDLIVGGCGIAALLPRVEGVCELQKMYVDADHRAQGVGLALLKTALAFAGVHFQWCYLETFSSMKRAAHLYRQAGFISLPKPLVETEHNACDGWFLREL